MTFSAQIQGAPIVSGGVFQQQFFSNVSMVFTANMAVGGNTNLLTVVSTANQPGSGEGFTGSGSSGALKSDTTLNDTVTFTSDFLFFQSTIDRDYTLSFSSILAGFKTGSPPRDPGVVLDPKGPVAQRGPAGYLHSFTASGTGTFASDPAPSVPDGASLGLMSGGLLPFAGFALYRRRRAKK